MTKELIISANVHEKKVAILENGLVTEFYVERRDENQGVVGNIYKGRVMKVLPGMQSAFVDIGLERDAFLYVSDFTEFLEEEEVDFKETSSAAAPAAAEEARAGREERRGRDRFKGQAEPQRTQREERRERDRGRQAEPEPEAAAAPEVELEDVVSQLEEINVERIIPPPPQDEDLEEEVAAEAADVTPEYLDIEEAVVERITDEDVIEPVEVEAAPEPVEEAADAAPAEAAPVEEAPAEAEAAEAAPAKTRRSRSRKKTTETEKPASRSRKSTAAAAETAEATEEAAPAKSSRKTSSRTSKRSTRRREEEPAEEASAAQFERVVDDDAVQEAGDLLKDAIVQEKIIEQVHSIEYRTAPPAEPEPEWRIGSFRSQLSEDSSFERIVDEQAEREEDVTPMRHISDVMPEEIRAGIEAASESSPSQDEAPADDEDREASLRDNHRRAEFAMRRGGRGRRRRRGETHDKSAAPRDGEEATAAAPEDGEGEAPLVESRTDGGRYSKSQRRSDRPPVTISELLHEGQEVIVQIAKEPIAKKGARITSHIALPGRYLVYMPTVNHIGVSRKIASEAERIRLKRLVQTLRDREGGTGGFIARTACAGHTDQELHDDMKYLLRTWADLRRKSERAKPPALVHRDLDLVQRILRDLLSDEFTAIRVDNEIEYARIVEFVNRVQPKLVNRVKLYTGSQPIFEKYGVQPEIDRAVRPRVWLRSGGYIVINQTEALVAIDVNTGKFVGKSDRLEDTITRTNLEAAKEVVRQIRLRDLGGIIVIDFIDMEERKNRQKVMAALQQELQADRAPSKILSINDFGLVAITRKRVKQSLERTLCTPCPYCQGAGMVKSPQTMCFEILEQAKAMSKQVNGSSDVMLRVSPDVAEALHTTEREVFEEIEAYFGTPVTIEADPALHQEQFDFAIL